MINYLDNLYKPLLIYIHQHMGGMMNAEKLLTPEDAAKALLVKSDTLRGWLRTGKLKGVKVGRLWRVRESDLEAFLQGGEAKEK
jgi:excisionase family DNA binding protein